MSRAMFIQKDTDTVETMCAKAKIAISTIEILPKGGTRLVCLTSEDADQARVTFRKSILDGAQPRSPMSVSPSRW
ncbi:hypothetical protein EKN06_03180 [Croceicoccus ponticola]|uniref:Uncharacterized protein n=1 Tax=Croceicoccus ponticola TaxID=2217664 RepID=A0A437H0Q5_9SPHN|nr:hypothetical protein [Croceicoccus ponticola]RVQ69217.1 hypothetical protein EKN06_03180 [Croceicoccus ponticola]